MTRDTYLPQRFRIAPKRYRFIMIHDTTCQWRDDNPYRLDKKMFQSGPMRARFKNIKQYDELPYHFICEKIGENVQTVVGRPLQYCCYEEYDDIDKNFIKNSIHVCLMGNYSNQQCTNKMYEQLAYRIVCPMMKMYRISKSNVILHGDVSKNNYDCPGFNFNKQILFAYMGRFNRGLTS